MDAMLCDAFLPNQLQREQPGGWGWRGAAELSFQDTSVLSLIAAFEIFKQSKSGKLLSSLSDAAGRIWGRNGF